MVLISVFQVVYPFKTSTLVMNESFDIFQVMFDEIEKQFATEFDYRKEAENLCKIHDNVIKGGFGREITVPRPIWEYTSKVGRKMHFMYSKP